MLEKVYVTVLCLFMFLISVRAFANQPVHHDQTIAVILKQVLPLNIEESSSLNDQEKADLECLSWNLYFEARGGAHLEQIAVAWVPINRKNYSHWSSDVCENVFQYSLVNGRRFFQFVWAGFNIGRNFKIESDTWVKVQHIAYKVYRGDLADPGNGATYFNHHTIGGRKGAIRLGSHLFYK